MATKVLEDFELAYLWQAFTWKSLNVEICQMLLVTRKDKWNCMAPPWGATMNAWWVADSHGSEILSVQNFQLYTFNGYCQPQASQKPKRCLGGFIFTLNNK